MNVLEIKNNLVKIGYETADNLALSEFLIIEDTNSPYVAQIMNLKSDALSNFAIAKLLFTFDEEGILKNYNGTIPSAKAVVSKLPSNELLDIIPVSNPLFLGTLAQQNISLRVDKTILENNLLICSDNLNNTAELLTNITGQLDEKTVIFDTEGVFDTESKILFGRDFKLPLNSETIDYIYENDLEDVDAVNKAVIQDIFLELQNYINTLPEKFLPFDTFLNVVDSQYRETNIPELILLKNKLLKYKELDVFAQDLKDVLSLSIVLEKSELTVVDISNVPDSMKRELITYIYSVMSKINEKIYAFTKIDNSIITKKLLKRLIDRDNVYTTIICPHELKYISELKEVSQNKIFFAPMTMTHDFAAYNAYLAKLNNDEFVIYGAHTQNIPLIVEITDYQESNDIEQEMTNTEENFSSTFSEIDENDEFENIEDDASQETIVEQDDIDTENDIIDSEQHNEPETSIDNSDESSHEEISHEEIQPVDNLLEDNEPVVEPLDIVDQEQAKDNYTEAPVIEAQVIEQNNDELVEQVAKDVDKSFYEKLPREDDVTIDEEPEIVEDELTEDDLNIIDDLASEDIPLAGNETETPPVIDDEKPPVVPIYPADDIEDSENTYFKPGDRVITKYGEGVVEQMVKYGNKYLCKVNHATIGIRLLNPAMTEVRKVDDI